MGASTITVLPAGTFTAADGQTYSFGQRELQDIADTYDPKADPAPLVVGTPGLADPAYGWVSRLYVDGDKLQADVQQVEPKFRDMVKAGEFPRVAARFYPPQAAGNPKAGHWYLKHVSFNGAARPKVAIGLYSFGENDDEGTIGLDSTVLPHQAYPVVLSQYRSSTGRVHTLNSYDVFDRVMAIQGENPDVALSAAVQMAVDGIEAGSSAKANTTEAVVLRKANELQAKNTMLSLSEALDIAGVASGGSVKLPTGYSADPERTAIYVAAMKLRAQDPMMSFSEAVKSLANQP